MISERVRPIRIGGKYSGGRKYAVSLEEVAEPRQREQQSLWVDWEGIARAIDLDPKERSLYFSLFRDGQDGRTLGLNRYQVRTLTDRITKKLQSKREAVIPFITELSDREKILQTFWASGTTFRTTCPFLGQVGRREFMELNELNRTLQDETALLHRIQGKLREAAKAVETSEQDVWRHTAAIKNDQKQAVLEERPWPSESAGKKLTELRAKVASATAAMEATESALETQRETVRELEAEVVSRRAEGFSIASTEPAAKFRRLLSELAQSAIECQAVARQFPVDDATFFNAIWPGCAFDPRDPYSNTQERQMRIMVFLQILGLWNHVKNNYEPSREV